MSVNSLLRTIKPACQGYWGERIYGELAYAKELSAARNNEFDSVIEKAAAGLASVIEKNGCVSIADAKDCEAALSSIGAACKEITVHAVGHAHIDMNWMWRYDETVNITLETFRTVLRLMEDFPDFTFAQSQASCYAIVERYDPELLAAIKGRVQAGKWEIAASTWTETDKNMPSGESLARHILYTKQYMAKLFGIKEDELKLDFEPDTFGHNINVPDICQAGGVDYYYHCRGNDKEELYRWRSPSGAEILVCREPWWYLGGIEPLIMEMVPSYCKRNGVTDFLRVYGVGDHGGGPTRRDLERITDMMSWPIYPTLRFATYKDFFDAVNVHREKFPVVERELNFVFQGCYTTQTRIKAANRIAEGALFEAEALSAWAAKLAGAKINNNLFEEAWRNVLFNHFHDIIPGSGVIDTREHAMGIFQETLACANSQKGIAVYAIGNIVDTTAVSGGKNMEDTNAEGAGVGFHVEEKYGLARVERGRGNRRGYLMFNLAPERNTVCDVTLWDWQGDLSALSVTDASGKALEFQLLDKGFNPYWGHDYMNIAVKCELPAYGYALVVVDENADAAIPLPPRHDPRLMPAPCFDLENDKIKVCISSTSGAICSITDKKTGKTAAANGRFEGFTEDENPMSAWVISRHQNDRQQIHATYMEWVQKGPVRQVVKVCGQYKSSKIEYTYTLDSGAESVAIDAKIDWLEPGSKEAGVPQMHYVIEPAVPSGSFLYDIAYGTIVRKGEDMDMPGITYAASQPASGPATAILSETKYGYRCVDGMMSLTLIRSSFGPDPYPELFRHRISFHVAAVKEATPAYLDNLSRRLMHKPFAHSVPANNGSGSPAGKLPAVMSLISVKSGSAAIESVKLAEDGSGDLVIRLSDTAKGGEAAVALAMPVKAAKYCSLTETPSGDCRFEGNDVVVNIRKQGVTTVRVSV